MATARIAKHLKSCKARFRKEVLIVWPIDKYINCVMNSQVRKGLYLSFNSEFDVELFVLDLPLCCLTSRDELSRSDVHWIAAACDKITFGAQDILENRTLKPQERILNQV